MCNRKTYWVPTFLVLAVMAIAGATVRADSGLVGWWPLDEGSGTVAKDASGNGHDGVFNGEPQWVAGRKGTALAFNGDDYVDTGFTENLAVWTAGCWVKSPTAPGATAATGPLHRESAFQINWNHTNATFRGVVALNVGGTWHAASFGPMEADTWYHLVGTYDGENLQAFKNGLLITNNEAPSGAPRSEANTLKLGRHASAAQFFAGTVDDARLYNRALSAKEIQRAMNGYSVEPVAWYKFDETAGTVAVDSIGGRNGALLPPDPDGKGLGPKWVAGKFDGGIQFDGGPGNTSATNDYVELPIGDLISTLSSTTVAAWVNWAGTGGAWQRIFDFGSGTNSYMFLTPSRSGTNSARFALRSPTVGDPVITAPAILPRDWHYLAIAMDSATM